MSSRFILSLKKAGSEPPTLLSLPIIDLDPVSWADGRDVQPGSQMLGGLDGIPGTSATSNRGDVELSLIPLSPRIVGHHDPLIPL